jgi:hypothetical protein
MAVRHTLLGVVVGAVVLFASTMTTAGVAEAAPAPAPPPPVAPAPANPNPNAGPAAGAQDAAASDWGRGDNCWRGDGDRGDRDHDCGGRGCDNRWRDDHDDYGDRGCDDHWCHDRDYRGGDRGGDCDDCDYHDRDYRGGDRGRGGDDCRDNDRQRGEFSGYRVRMHTGPHVRDRVVGVGDRGDRVNQLGDQRGDRVRCRDGQLNDRWLRVRNQRNGVVGWVSDCYIDN